MSPHEVMKARQRLLLRPSLDLLFKKKTTTSTRNKTIQVAVEKYGYR
jgi:hypothetical protein